MKKIKIIALCVLAFITIASTVFVSCKKNKTQIVGSLSGNHYYRNFQRSGTPVAFESLLTSIGIIHNEAMEYAYNYFKTNNIFATHNSMQQVSLMRKLVANFYKDYMVSRSIDVEEAELESFLNNQPTILNNGEISVSLSEGFDSLANLMNNAKSVSNYESNAMALMSAIQPNLSSDQEEIAWEASVRVAISSFAYWTKNLSKWEKEYTLQTGVTTTLNLERNVPGTGRADAHGAITGGIRGAVSGTLFGSPVGGLAGGIFGAAVGASISSLSWIATHW